MKPDALILSRLQFVWVIAWHILLPAFTVGLASYIAFVEGLYFSTGRQLYFRISSFWTKIFSISFGMGVVSGIIMPFQFGTNWSQYADATANILSPLFAYEGLTAFFPRGRVSRRIAVRPQTRSAVGTFFRRHHGGGGDSVLFVLDPRHQ
jgi:cytochrome d ubiquinol oxidase subunit I